MGDNKIVPHPASQTSAQTFLAMLLENYSDAQSIICTVVDKNGDGQCFATNMRNMELTFHNYLTDDYVRNKIEDSD